jgi:3-oxoacyl-[acyl-carrier-protein] synthase II
VRTPTPRRVAITGIGLVTPVGTGIQRAWDNILLGTSGVGPITRFPTEGLKTTIAAEVKDFEPTDYLDRKAIKRLETFIQYAVGASRMALSDSGLDPGPELLKETACSLGCGLGGLRTMEENHAVIMGGRPDRISPFFIPMMIGNMAAGIVAMELGLRGPNYLCSTACAAGTHAIGLGSRLIRDEGYPLVVAGGAESVITPLSISGFNSIKAISTRNSEPHLASRPFDRDRDGFVLGEGAGIVILEEMERALSRGARIYAEVLGFGASCDAFHFTAPPEDGAGAILAMEKALEDASSLGVSKADISYINAHGTSTGLNDRIETLAIKQVFGDLAPKLAISSTKSEIGHLLGAAGGVEAAFLALAIHNGIVPPTANLTNPDPELDLDYVPLTARKMAVKAGMSNSFGFGGTNGVLVLGAPGAWAPVAS